MKTGMYGEMPIVRIGDMRVSQFTDKEGEKELWIENEEGEGTQVKGKSVNELSDLIKEWFDKNF